MDTDHWTYSEWEENTVEKIIIATVAAPEEDRADYLRVQIRAAIRKALRHGQSGRTENDPVAD